MGHSTSERSVGRMLCGLYLRSKVARKYKPKMDSRHQLLVVLNLLDRQFTVLKPNIVWMTDTTYIQMQQG